MLQTDLTIPAPPAVHTIPCPGQNRFSVVARDAAERPALEQRIRSGFGTYFGACVEAFMPSFARYEHHRGGTGIIGFRRASDEPLYLENYLTAPIETTIRTASASFVSRDRIAEIGQFVVDDRDIVAEFFRDLVPFLAGSGFDWVCFTGTNRIRAILKHVGFGGLQVATASAEQVSHASDHWGRYYDFDPVVIIGRLDDPRGRWCRDMARTPPLANIGS